MKPCGACCLRGTPDQCSLETSDDAQSYISQANEIKRLRKLVADLELRLSRDAGTSESTGPVSILPARPRPSTEAAPSGSNFPFVSVFTISAAPLSSISPLTPRTFAAPASAPVRESISNEHLLGRAALQ